MRRIFGSLAAATLMAFGALAETDAPEACPQRQAVSFEDIVGAHKAILFGEYHGTNEMPAAFAEAVREASGGERRVVVALEYPPGWQDDLDAVMAAPNELAAIDAFAMHHTVDGRTSNAMRNLLLKLRAMKLAGADIHVIAADSRFVRTEEDEAAVAALDLPERVDRVLGARDLDLALHSEAACEAVNCDLILLYAGNLHTRLTTTQSGMLNTLSGEIMPFWTAPAGYVLRQSMPTASVVLVHRGGLATNMTGNTVSTKEIQPTAPDYVVEDNTYYCAGPDNVSHVLSVGKISSSADTLAPATEGN